MRTPLAVACAAFILSGCDSASPPVSRPPTEYPLQEERWDSAEIKPTDVLKLDKALAAYLRTESRYKSIESLRPGGVPAPVVFALHGRESAWNFSRHLHEGSPLTGRTRDVPKGRIPGVPPPYTFEQSAEDALYTLKRLDRINWRSLGDSLQAVEAYNGLGYQKYHPEVPSPYLWASTTLYDRGKYVADGKFSASAVDKQLGCAAIFKRMQEREIPLPFANPIKQRPPEKRWRLYPFITAIAGEQPGQYEAAVELRGTVNF